MIRYQFPESVMKLFFAPLCPK